MFGQRAARRPVARSRARRARRPRSASPSRSPWRSMSGRPPSRRHRSSRPGPRCLRPTTRRRQLLARRRVPTNGARSLVRRRRARPCPSAGVQRRAAPCRRLRRARVDRRARGRPFTPARDTRRLAERADAHAAGREDPRGDRLGGRLPRGLPCALRSHAPARARGLRGGTPRGALGGGARPPRRGHPASDVARLWGARRGAMAAPSPSLHRGGGGRLGTNHPGPVARRAGRARHPGASRRNFSGYGWRLAILREIVISPGLELHPRP